MKPKVLIVEDEGIVAMDIENVLRELDCEITGIAYTGEEAVAMARASPPDLILMDIGLKGEIDGITAARIIQESCQSAVIYLTGFADDKTLDRAQETNPLGYLTKPLDDFSLKKVIKDCLSKIN
ncbi:MAG: response regulator [Acidobacteriota bacterium]